MMENTTKPFGQLSNAEKKELVCAWIDGKKIEFYHHNTEVWKSTAPQPAWHSITCYRIANESPMTIPWSLIDRDFNYAAKDKNGDIWFYSGLPVMSDHFGNWLSSGMATFRIGRTTLWGREVTNFLGGDCDWKESLTKRPS